MRSDNILEYNDSGKKMGCVIIFFLLFGVTVFLGASGFFVLSYMEGNLTAEKFSYGSPFVIFGLLAIFGPLRNLKFSYRYTTIVDGNTKKLTFYKEDENDKLEIPFGQFACIRLVKTWKQSSSSSSNSRSYPEYHMYLVMGDGSHFWLDTYGNESTLKEEVSKLNRVLQITVKDESGCNLSESKDIPFENKPIDIKKVHSEFVIESKVNGMDSVTIKKPRNLLDDINMLLVFLFFGSLLSMVFTIGGIATIIMGSFMGLILLFAVLAVVFIAGKKYNLYITDDHLLVQLSFQNSIVQNWFGRTLEISKDNLIQVRTSRLHEGHFWLSCVTKEKVSLGNQILFGAGAFAKSKVKSIESEHVLGLWEVPNYAKKGDMANFMDLYFLEYWIQDKMNLQERKLTIDQVK